MSLTQCSHPGCTKPHDKPTPTPPHTTEVIERGGRLLWRVCRPDGCCWETVSGATAERIRQAIAQRQQG